MFYNLISNNAYHDFFFSMLATYYITVWIYFNFVFVYTLCCFDIYFWNAKHIQSYHIKSNSKRNSCQTCPCPSNSAISRRSCSIFQFQFQFGLFLHFIFQNITICNKIWLDIRTTDLHNNTWINQLIHNKYVQHCIILFWNLTQNQVRYP